MDEDLKFYWNSIKVKSLLIPSLYIVPRAQNQENYT